MLFQLRNEIAKLENSVWRNRKLQEAEQLIQDCLGLFCETTSTYYQIQPGEKAKVNIELVNRSSTEVKLQDIRSPRLQWDTAFSNTLGNNTLIQIKTTASLDPSAEYSDPYWLKEEHSQGIFTVKDKANIGLPENPPAVEFVFNVVVGNEKLAIRRPLIYKWVDPVKGELWRPVEIVPVVFVNPAEKVIIFNNSQPKEVSVIVKSSADRVLNGKLILNLPNGWKSEPASHEFELKKREEEQRRSFLVYPSQAEYAGEIRAEAQVNGKKYGQALQLISYDHIPTQTLLPPSEIKVARIELKKEGSIIGYIKGAGDDIPSALRNMGYEVWEMKNDEVTATNLKRLDAVVLGIRALNTNSRIGYFMDELLEYVKTGGTLVVQYNTNFDFETEKFSPFPLKLSRDRVTQEDSEVRILKPDHEVLNTPNKITSKDFNGWVQERGLYFPNQWDTAFEAVLSMNDTGETPKDGSLLIAKYGQGHYVYTGLSFFRELPEGVTGAYKLFANIVSIGKTKKVDNTKAKDKTK